MSGKIFFFSGPSGVGKGTVIRLLKKNHPEWVFPPSCTTRDPRPGEVDGETYFFLSPAEFDQKIANDELLEWAVVHGGNRYGTLRQKLLEPVKKGKVVIREFDVQGFLQAKKQLDRKSFVSIFLRPEHEKTLIARILKRAPMSEDEVVRRTKSMREELRYVGEYDHVIVSRDGDISRMVTDAEKIIFDEFSK